MRTLRVLSEVRHRNVTLWAAGDRLRFSPASALTPELLEELRQHKEDILSILRRREEHHQDTSPHLGLGGRIQAIARERAQRKDSSPSGSLPAPGGGRDPLVHRGSDKGQFFKGDWRQTWPHDFKVYRGERP